MNLTEIKNLIEKHEGRVDEVYEDSVGVKTCGIGHALHIGSAIPTAVTDMLFQQDFLNVLEAYDKFEEEFHTDLDNVRKGVIVNMLFNLGEKRLRRFKKMITALVVHDYVLAAEEMLDSKWARQVKGRAYMLARMMETGIYLGEA